jgi:tetratricopeptide (TPR) repeat protein
LILALLQRSLCYRAKGEYDEAKRDLNQVLLIEPDHNEAQVK